MVNNRTLNAKDCWRHIDRCKLVYDVIDGLIVSNFDNEMEAMKCFKYQYEIKVVTFDGKGNYSLGLKEQIVFPEIDYDNLDSLRGMDITIVTSAKNDEQGLELLKSFNLPIN